MRAYFYIFSVYSQIIYEVAHLYWSRAVLNTVLKF